MIRPQGCASRKKARSFAVMERPLKPVMKARVMTGAD
jgi:hypothetical protein